jgi:hypothetical protein
MRDRIFLVRSNNFSEASARLALLWGQTEVDNDSNKKQMRGNARRRAKQTASRRDIGGPQQGM